MSEQGIPALSKPISVILSQPSKAHCLVKLCGQSLLGYEPQCVRNNTHSLSSHRHLLFTRNLNHHLSSLTLSIFWLRIAGICIFLHLLSRSYYSIRFNHTRGPSLVSSLSLLSFVTRPLSLFSLYFLFLSYIFSSRLRLPFVTSLSIFVPFPPLTHLNTHSLPSHFSLLSLYILSI